MTTLRQLYTFELADDWTPEQALAVHEALETLLGAVWISYGTQIQQTLADEQCIDNDTPQLDLFDPDDPLPF